MKRLMAVIIALLVMIAPVTAFGACSHQSTAVKYVKATVEKNGSKKTVCKSCGTTVKKTTILKVGEVKASTVTYNGKYRKPAVKVYNSKGTLIDPANYTVTYKKTKSIGTHYATVTFQGKKYKGEVKVPYVIRPAKPMTEGDAGENDGEVCVSWGPVDGVDGYEVSLSRTRDFENADVVKGVTESRKVFTDKDPGRNYYFKVRAYKEKNKKRYYSLWSDVKKTQARGKCEPADNETVLNTSVNLFASLVEGKKDENILISPVSLLMCLGMIENGADDETLAQMESALGVGAEELAAWAESYMDVKDENLKLANSVWYKKADDFEIFEGYCENIRASFKGDVKEAAFDQNTVTDINNWCDEKTDGMIKKVIDKLSKDARVVLANATYFKAGWSEPYSEKSIEEKVDFTNSTGAKEKVTMLCKTDEFGRYYSDEEACGFKLEYRKGDADKNPMELKASAEDRGYYFLAILPNEDVDVMEYAASLDGERLKDFLKESKEAELTTKVPEFSYDYDEKDLINSMKELGIEDLFDGEKANLKKVGRMKNEGDNLFVSQFIHKTRIKLDRNGTEAAAVTVAVMDKATAVPDPEKKEKKEIILDRPFIYAICDSKTDIPVFIGVVNKVN